MEVTCGGDLWRWPVEVTCGGDLWRWPVEVTCGGGLLATQCIHHGSTMGRCWNLCQGVWGPCFIHCLIKGSQLHLSSHLNLGNS